jgi:hypothetical protein
MYFLNVKCISLTTECESDILKLPTDYISWTVLVISAGYNYIYMCVQSIPELRNPFNINVCNCDDNIAFASHDSVSLSKTELKQSSSVEADSVIKKLPTLYT